MRMHEFSYFTLAGLATYAFTLSTGAQDHQHMMTESAAAQTDARQLVTFPEPMRIGTITSMGDHLLALWGQTKLRRMTGSGKLETRGRPAAHARKLRSILPKPVVDIRNE